MAYPTHFLKCMIKITYLSQVLSSVLSGTMVTTGIGETYFMPAHRKNVTYQLYGVLRPTK
jgi:hypothetical protein